MKNIAHRQRNQRGISLIELMVGIVIGLLVVAVASGVLMVSRGVSGTVSDASTIQQQAAYAMRLIGTQVRQAGSSRLNLNSANAATQNDLFAPVAFEQQRDGSADVNYNFSLHQPTALFNGTANSLTVGFQRYKDSVFNTATEQTTRNCVGGPDGIGTTATYQLVQSIFQMDANNQLVCSGNGEPAQPVIQNVANFTTRYLRQVVNPPDTLFGNPLVQYVAASTVANWGQVQGVEVCMVLYGVEPIDMPAGSSYTDCDGTTVNMTTLTGVRANRLHMVFRSVFQYRAQGMV
jgi:type IV pilus assembly protein PilW